MKQLVEIGVEFVDNGDHLVIHHNDLKIIYWKKSAWFSGKGVKDGRGINNLIKQLKAQGNGAYSDQFTNNPESYNHIVGIFQKHLGFEIPKDKKDIIKANLMSRFKIELKR